MVVMAGGDLEALQVVSHTDDDANDITLTTTAGAIRAGAIDAGSQGDVALHSASAITDLAGKIRADQLLARATGTMTLDTTVAGLDAVTSAAGSITVTETGSIVLSNVQTTDGAISVTADGSILNTDAGQLVTGHTIALTTDADIGSSSNPIRVDTGSGMLEASAQGEIFLVEVVGDMPVSAAVADGNVTLITESGSIVDSPADQASEVKGVNITLTAQGGGIGTPDSDLGIDTLGGRLTATAMTAGQSVYLNEVAGDLTLSQVTVSNTGTVTLKAEGQVLDDADAGAVDISGGSAVLMAGSGIGTGNALETQVNRLEANGGTGGIWAVNAGGLTIGGIAGSPVADGLSAGEAVVVTALSPLTVEENVTSPGDIILTAGNSAGEDNLVVSNGVEIHTTGGSVTLQSGDNITIAADAQVTAASGQVTILGDYGDADAGGGTVELYGQIQSPLVQITTQGDNDTIVLTNVTSGSQTTVSTGDGDDRVHVGSHATPNSNSGGNVNSINGLLSIDAGEGNDQLVVDDTEDSEANTGTLTLDTIDGLGMTAGGISYAWIEDLTVSLGSGDDDFVMESTNSDTATVLNSNNGDDRVSMLTTAGVSTVNTGEGSDIINVQSISDTATINAGTGDDVINVGSEAPDTGGNVEGIHARLTVDGGSGADRLNVDDTGNTDGNIGYLTATTVSELGMGVAIDYSMIEDLNISLGVGGDHFTIVSTHSGATTVNTHSGGDTVNVAATSGETAVHTAAGNDVVNVRAIGAVMTVDTGADEDTINVGSLAPDEGGDVNAIDARLTVDGGSGSDVLNLDDSGDATANSGVLNAATLTGLGMASGISYDGLEDLTVSLGSGSDTLLVEDTHSGATLVETNDGSDTVHVQNTAGVTTVNTNTGNDIVNIEDIHGTTMVNTAEGSDTVNAMSTHATATINTGVDEDTINIRTIGAAMTVNAGDDHDTINAGSLAPAAGGVLNAISAPLTVNGEGGFDTLNVDDTGDPDPNTGTLTEDSITGLGMSDGITYGTLEHLNIGLGAGGDSFTIEDTHTGTTSLNSNAGDNTIGVLTTSGVTTINTGDDEDTVNIRTIGAAMTVNAGDDDDTISVGSLAPATGGTVNAINAILTLNAQGGFDTLNVDDTGDAAPNAGVLSADSITGLGMAFGIAYDGIEDLEIGLGTAGDTFTIESTHAADTTLNTGAGDDTAIIVDIHGKTTVNTAEGSDNVNVLVTHATATINTGDEEDTVNIRMIGAAMAVNAGDDNDTINAGSLVPAMGGIVNAISAPLTINGEEGDDTLNVDDTGDTDPNTGTLTEDTITGLGMSDGIIYGAVETLAIGLGPAGDEFTIESTHGETTLVNTNAGKDTVHVLSTAGETTIDTGTETDIINVQSIDADTTILAGAGDDFVYVGSDAPAIGSVLDLIAGPLTISGGGGIDTVRVDDIGDAADNTGVLTATTLTGLGMAAGITSAWPQGSLTIRWKTWVSSSAPEPISSWWTAP
jgi:acrosin